MVACFALLLALALGQVEADATGESGLLATAPAPLVFFDIAGQDTAKLPAFYANVFGWKVGPEVNHASSLSVPVKSPLSGAIRKEAATHQPPNETLLYLGVEDISATLASIVAQGGAVVYPRIEVPGTVVMALFKDPAGNRMGLVEMENGIAKIPSRPK